MQATKIKVDEYYAVSTEPRKGWAEDELHTIRAKRIRVEKKGVQRIAEHSIRSSSGLLRDGIEGFDDGSSIRVYKARDFLMPWDEYVTRHDAWAKQQNDARAAAKAKDDALIASRDAIVARLREDYGLTSPNGMSLTHIRVSVTDMETLLSSMSDRLYELLAEAS